VIASDISEQAVLFSKENAGYAEMEELIEFEVCDFEDTTIPESENGIVIFNPEYGERLGEEEELGLTYKRIGDFLKQKCGGYTGYIFSGNPSLAKKSRFKSFQKN
jgi:putative N6-adenine-specific DNA methylase